ncbi:uncharacterized protein LOC121412561 [Lytechinus variegatus]|uniref:uncharacterized protein LOC121412561 n=1 Tax=Lytechinus variegatus TaxID=7654 RepID=UPI001BB20557|nr:uncharacterized protein LOC121412561 [Lytechinus variegatus]
MAVEMLTTCFEAVEEGLMTDDDYFFELISPSFFYTSGEYHQAGQLMTTMLAWSNISRLQDEEDEANILIAFPTLNGSYDLKVQLIIDNCKDLNYQMKGNRENNIRVKWAAEQMIHVNLNEHRLFRNRKIGGKLGYILMISWLYVICHRNQLAEALPANTEHPPVNLIAGSNGIVPFACRKADPFAAKYYSLHLEGKDVPFYMDGVFVPEGLMSTDQVERFNMEFVENDQEMSIEINIAQVSVEDQGTYIAILIVQGDTTESHVMKRAVMIVIPPGPAICFLMPSEIVPDRHEIHCHSERGSGDSTLTCFQQEDKIPYFQVGDEQSDSQVVYRRRFWMLNTDVPVYCCSHDIEEIGTIQQKSCNQFRFPTGPEPEPEISTTLKPYKSTKIARITKSIFIEDNNNPSSETTSLSGSDRNVDRSSLIVPLMFLIIYLIME